MNLYVAGTVSFVVAASFNWFLNRIWTFRGIDHAPLHLQWAKFLIANSIGFVANRGVFFFLVASSGVVVAYPIIGVAAGSLAGLVFNYFLSKTFVFR
ncbi:putative GtrA family protein [Acidocella sp. MX-AZ02]|nr:putative GtrA family protein [Acidocella sp. MX-AZ02]